MIRKKKEYPLIIQYKSKFFWRDCRFCNNEFKNENGFKITEAIKGIFQDSYCCRMCASSIDEVKFKLQEENKNRLEFLKDYAKYGPNDYDDCDDCDDCDGFDD